MHFPPFNFEKSRFERKFAIQEMHYHDIIQHVKINCGAFSSLYHPRYINNIYFDTNDLDFYTDNVSGKGSRKKARIRWYGDRMGKIDNPVLEFKMREGMVGNKVSFPLRSFTIDKNFTVGYIHDILSKSELPDWASTIMNMLKPSLLNRYSRQYFISFDRNFRLTVDKELTYLGIGSNNNSFMEKYTTEDVIVELKYDQVHDGKKAAYIINNLPFRLTKSSKYVNGFELLHPDIT